MATYDYDLLVLGAGSGGLATAKRAASYGARVAILESDRVGGTCVIRGCIPKKLMVYASEFGRALGEAADYGWQTSPGHHDFERFVSARNEAVLGLERTHERLLSEAGVELLRGSGVVAGAHEVDVAGRRVSAERILIATGATPSYPRVEGIEHAITSDGFFELTSFPRRVAIVGAGYIAVELAAICEGLGAEVHVVLRGDLPLRGFDGDLREELAKAMTSSGIQLHTGTTVRRIRREGSSSVLELTGPDGDRDLEVDQALIYATGRAPNSAGLGLPEVGVKLAADGSVESDEAGATAVPSIFAVGDVTGRAMLTPVAITAGRALADRLWGGKDSVMDYSDIPTAVFSHPPIGTVGLTEEQAVEQYGREQIQTFTSRFNPLVHMLTETKVATLVKLIVNKADDKVLGCHLIGHDAGEIIQGFAVAVKMGATKADFDRTIGIHPTTAEELVTMG
jgi:glutathione reductase (NADPH)